jgi:hypothetical protein
MNSSQKEAQVNLVRISSYFELLKEQPPYRLEYEVVKATVALIASTENFTQSELVTIAQTANRIVGYEHASGSGWLDFEGSLSWFFRTLGYQSAWNSITGEFTFWLDDFSFRLSFWKWLT